MPVLLDTNIFIGLMAYPENLGQETTKIISEADQACFSIISLWEIVHLQKKKRITLTLPPEDLWNASIRQAGLSQLYLDEKIIDQYARLPDIKDHKDPFDRMLIATAVLKDFPLIGSDNAFKKYKDLTFQKVAPVF